MGVIHLSALSIQKMNTNHDEDPYAFLLPLCGTTAFRLPSMPPGPHPSCGLPPPPTLFGPIPDHLLHHYLCYDPPPNSSVLVPDDPPPPAPLLRDGPQLRDDDGVAQRRDIEDDDGVHQQQREILPLCVVNYQDSLPPTPEAEGFSWASMLLSEIKNLAIYQHGNDVLEGDYLLSVITKFRNLAFKLGYGRKVLTQIKELARCRMDVVLLDKSVVNYMLFVMKKFRILAYRHCDQRNFCDETDCLELPFEKKKQKRKKREIEAYTEPSLSSGCSTLLRRSRRLEKQSFAEAMANLMSGSSKLVDEHDNIDLTSDRPSREQSVITTGTKEALVRCQMLTSQIRIKPRFLDADEP